MDYQDSITKLDDFDDEDISDAVSKLERSFGLKFKRDAFSGVDTFGDLCAVFSNHIIGKHTDDCTHQQAFYRVRKAIITTLKVDVEKVKLNSRLSDLFPEVNRRQQIKEFKRSLEVDVKILTHASWLSSTLITGLLLSLAAFFCDWKITIVGVVFFVSAMKIAARLGRTFTVHTVRELTEKLLLENYINVRRRKDTINKHEIRKIIVEIFSRDLGIEKAHLTNEARLSWAS